MVGVVGCIMLEGGSSCVCSMRSRYSWWGAAAFPPLEGGSSCVCSFQRRPDSALDLDLLFQWTSIATANTTVVTSFRGMLKVDLTSVKVPYRRTFDICPSFWLHRAFECGQLVNRGVARSAKSILRSRRAGDSLEGSRGPQTPPSGTHKPRPADAGK